MLSLKCPKYVSKSKFKHLLLHRAMSVFTHLSKERTQPWRHHTIILSSLPTHPHLHDRARKAAATAIICADATALSALGLDNRAGGRRDGRSRRRHGCGFEESLVGSVGMRDAYDESRRRVKDAGREYGGCLGLWSCAVVMSVCYSRAYAIRSEGHRIRTL
mgnify:CR=1 FL=1